MAVDETLREQIRRALADEISAVEIGRGTVNAGTPQGIVEARSDRLVFRRVTDDATGHQLAAVRQLVKSVLGGTNPATWRGGPAAVLRELMRTCNNGYVYCRPLSQGERG